MTRERFLREIDQILMADRLARLERERINDRLAQLALDQVRDRIAAAETAARLETEQVRAEVIRLQDGLTRMAVELALETQPDRPAIEAPKQWFPNQGIRPA